jgi:spermidine synthase
VTWQKYLATLVGSHGEATAAVLAIFLGGLSAGYSLFGWATRGLAERARRSGRSPRLLLFYALVEGGIGIYILIFPTLFGFARSLSLLAPAGQAGLGFAFDVGLSTLLIGPPAVLMGGTIPILTLALAGDLARATRVHAWVYGFNTAGAFAGALAAGFFLIPLLGLDGVLYAMGPLNLLAALAFVLLERFGESAAPDLAAPGPAAPPVRGFAAYAGVALLAGFAMMTVQTVLIRIGCLSFGASQFTFAMVVAVFVLSIAAGSLSVSALSRIPSGVIVGSQWALVLTLLLLYYQMPEVPYWAHVIRAIFQSVDAAFYPFYSLSFIALLAALILPIGLSGALLPLLFHHLRRELGSLGSVAGHLYSWNTAGSLLGALLGGYVLLFWLDLHHVYRIALAALVGGAAILTVLVLRAPPLLTALLVVLPAVAGLWTLPAWSPERLAAGLFRQRQPTPATFRGADAVFARRASATVFHEDDPTTTVTVRDLTIKGGQVRRGIITNGKPDGNLVADYPTMALSALIPALMADTAARCFVVGYGTGVTAGELAALQLTREIHVAEISQGVIDAAPFFEAGNLNASTSPKVTIQRGDAYRTLLRSTGQYDLIVSEPSNPWVNGVEMLYSVEFLEAARARLAPGGVYGQWFHLYEIDTESVRLVLRSYASVFPHVSVWFTMRNDVLLLGFDRPGRALDLRAIEARFGRPDFAEGFARVGIESFLALLAHELLPLGTLHAAELEGQLHTLRHPILSYRAARAFFRGAPAQLPKFPKRASARVGARNSLLRRYAGGRDGTLSESVLERAARESCRLKRPAECATLLARWKRDYPGSTRLRASLADLRRAPASRDAVPTNRKLAELVAFFDGRAPDGPSGEDPLERATRITKSFLSHYHHAAPFDRKALSAAWARCAEPACEDARRGVEARVGGLRGRANAQPVEAAGAAAP